MPAINEWLTPAEAAAVINVHIEHIYASCAYRNLRHTRLGGKRSIRIHRDWLKEWMEGATAPVVSIQPPVVEQFATTLTTPRGPKQIQLRVSGATHAKLWAIKKKRGVPIGVLVEELILTAMAL